MVRKTCRRHIAVALLSVAILGCEAPLVLNKVEKQRALPTQRSDLLQSVAATDSTLVAVGSRGVVATSKDQGETWRRTVLDGKPFLMTVTTCPDGSFVALDYGKAVWFGDPSGSEWHKKDIATYETVQTLTCDANGGLWVVGSFSSIIHSADGGDSWTESFLDEDLHFTSIQFVNEQTAFMTGEFGVVARSTDAGQTWEMLEPLPDEFYPQDALFVDENTGWVVGLTGTIMATRDGGASWAQQSSGTSVPLYNIARNGSKLYVVGGNGLTLKSNLDEATGNGPWSSIQHNAPIRFYLRGVAAVGDDRLLVAGGAGALFVIPTGS